MTWASIGELKAATRAAKERLPGRRDYFGPGVVAVEEGGGRKRWIESRAYEPLYGGRYFVESSRLHVDGLPGQPLLWHVIRAGGPHDDPHFDTLGPWPPRGYADRATAKAVAGRSRTLSGPASSSSGRTGASDTSRARRVDARVGSIRRRRPSSSSRRDA